MEKLLNKNEDEMVHPAPGRGPAAALSVREVEGDLWVGFLSRRSHLSRSPLSSS